MSHLKNEEEKLLGEFSNIFGDKKKKEPQHEIINRELLMPHRYLLTIPKFQKLLFKQFQSILFYFYFYLLKDCLIFFWLPVLKCFLFFKFTNSLAFCF